MFIASPLLLPAAAAAAPVPTMEYVDPQGTFKLQVPKGWQQVNLVPGTGILASWYDPANRGSDTLVVYAAPTAAASTRELGTAQEVGEALAGVSPGGSLQQWGSDRRSKGREYITTQVRFTGVSAGLFGAVLDIRCCVVAEGQKYTLRISSKADNIEGNAGWYQTVNRIVQSFQRAAAGRARQCFKPRASSTVAAEVAGPAAKAADNYPIVDIREQCKELRARVCKETLAGGLIYVSGGDLQHRNGADVYYKFRPSSDFAYLTGVTEPGFACLLDPETQRFTLVAPKVPEDAAVWWGGLPSLDQLAEQAGAAACIYTEDLPQYVQQHHSDVQTLHILPGDDPQQQAQLLGLPHFAQHQQQAVQQLAGLQALQAVQSSSTGSTAGRSSSTSQQIQLSTAFLESTLHRCRATKTAAEVGCLMEASRGSAAAHKAMWAACKPGLKEYQLEAAFAHAAGQAGLMQLGYPCIVGAGANGAILHYERNSATVKPNDLVLVDAGAEFRHYTADITRTFPASGKFTAQQRDIYDVVLSMQQHALSQIQPGASWADIQQSTRQLLLQQLQQLGLVKGSADALTDAGIDRVFMPHGLGHFLGLDVHDVSDVGPVPQRLQAGHVITVEPGLYFMPLLLQRAFNDPKQAPLLVKPAVEALLDMGGVRIEDNVLVTDSGHFNLTMAAGMPKEAAEIEAYMAAHNASCSSN
ncbi:hypothetical protein OEZ85_006043 [Tetradesmus obliquus]|uniref:Aminopeptidase P N-terminal domain-containing protein n=1 Tax=Tetradesmus obliquus TaxID=3088 RepID=A0ABY8UGA5_TETOB|nr:hypothetical protein OEZ85_006043 [Tetradesmus obliquus]